MFFSITITSKITLISKEPRSSVDRASGCVPKVVVCLVLVLLNVCLNKDTLVLLILFMTLKWHVRAPCFVIVPVIECKYIKL